MKKSLGHILVNLAYQSGGSHKTRSDRENTAQRFASFLNKENIKIELVEHIKASYIRDYVEWRKKNDIAIRTIANEMAHLRSILRKAGRDKLANNPSLNNKSLGIDGGSRKGTKIPCPHSVFQNFLVLARKRDKGLAVCIMLGFYLGLRREEAIQSIQSIQTWYDDLAAGKGIITVIFGTKGGRERQVRIFNTGMALTTLKFALRVMKERKGKLIDKPNLKEACYYFSNTTRAIGMEGQLSFHSLRYAFAVSIVKSYEDEGKTEKEAFGLASINLGHGGNRGRYIKMVYGRTLVLPDVKLPNINSIEELGKLA
ncbi:MAG: DNA-binding protein [Methylotenera sp.]|nr:MAG: DNA-binding protein [Methylotenera sp.]